jgi:two-component sensor histidine kinase
VELRVRDNGTGLPVGLDFTSVNSLGLKLVRKLTENQIKGQIECNSHKGEGVEFIIRFKNEEKKDINS